MITQEWTIIRLLKESREYVVIGEFDTQEDANAKAAELIAAGPSDLFEAPSIIGPNTSFPDSPAAAPEPTICATCGRPMP